MSGGYAVTHNHVAFGKGAQGARRRSALLGLHGAFAVRINALRVGAVLAVTSEALFTIALAQGVLAEQTLQGGINASELRGQGRIARHVAVLDPDNSRST